MCTQKLTKGQLNLALGKNKEETKKNRNWVEKNGMSDSPCR